jgi:hypothetical protein
MAEEAAAGLPPVSGLVSVDLTCSISSIWVCNYAGDNLRELGVCARRTMTDSVESHFVARRATGFARRATSFQGEVQQKQCQKKSPAKGTAGLSCRDNAGRARTSSAGSPGTPCHDDRGRWDTVALRQRPERCRSQIHHKDSWSAHRSNRTSIRRSRNR